VVGVPLIAPVTELRVSPSGRNPSPATIDHENGALPPPVVSVAEYADPTTPLGSVAVAMDSGAETTIDTGRLAVLAGFPVSLTSIVKLSVPGVVAVPLIVPVLGLRLNPAGIVPTVTVHVYGSTPPNAKSV